MARPQHRFFTSPWRLMKRPLSPLRFARDLPNTTAIRPASSKAPVTDKSRILEKPTRFNPPSHAARRIKPRLYPGPKLTVEEEEAQSARKYPNMMPPEGSFMRWFLTNRALHAWITLGVLTSLAVYSISLSFVQSTAFRDDLPSTTDFKSHPIQSIRQWLRVYQLHVAHESEVVADKRRQKLEDAEKRKQFMRAHGVEPGFLTGTWMEKFGTIESDAAREAVRKKEEGDNASQASGLDEQSPLATEVAATHLERPKRKLWLGIW